MRTFFFCSLILSSLVSHADVPIPCLNGTDPTRYPGTCETGYLFANQQYQGRLFYWFFPAQSGKNDAPLVIWTQGGPGCSSSIAFEEKIGPFFFRTLNDQIVLKENPFSWNRDFHLLLVDNPVGSGFSYAEGGELYVDNTQQAASDFYQALLAFFAEHPEQSKNPVILAGESYAGHYSPVFAQVILENNAAGGPFIDLRGVFNGNGWVDPDPQATHIPLYGLETGLIDQNQAKYYQDLVVQARNATQAGNLTLASDLYTDVLAANVNGIGVNQNYILSYQQFSDVPQQTFLNLNSTKTALGVPSWLTYADCSDLVYPMFQAKGDIATSVADAVVYLLNAKQRVHVMFYSGNMDWEVPVAGTEAFLRNLQWPGQAQFNKAPNTQWIGPDGTPAGSQTNYDNLWRVVVDNAGHMAPMYQPKNMQALVTQFVDICTTPKR